jgi:hypothetical protein
MPMLPSTPLVGECNITRMTGLKIAKDVLDWFEPLLVHSRMDKVEAAISVYSLVVYMYENPDQSRLQQAWSVRVGLR